MSEREIRMNQEENREEKAVEDPVETASARKSADAKEDNSSSPGLDNRRILIWSVAGIYLVYLGIRLCTGFLRHEEGSAPFVMIFGLIFVVMGGYLVFRTMKEYSLSEKRKKETKREELQEPKKKTISERAHMTVADSSAIEDAGSIQAGSKEGADCDGKDEEALV